MKRAEIIISGIVQGVGFRPFLYNFSRKYDLTGEIKNTGNLGVLMSVFSQDDGFDFQKFTLNLKNEAPKISFIENIEVSEFIVNDSQELYSIIENQIVPLYYTQDEEGIPHDWVNIMKQAIMSTASAFSTRRMMKEYYTKFYQNILGA